MHILGWVPDNNRLRKFDRGKHFLDFYGAAPLGQPHSQKRGPVIRGGLKIDFALSIQARKEYLFYGMGREGDDSRDLFEEELILAQE